MGFLLGIVTGVAFNIIMSRIGNKLKTVQKVLIWSAFVAFIFLVSVGIPLLAEWGLPIRFPLPLHSGKYL